VKNPHRLNLTQIISSFLVLLSLIASQLHAQTPTASAFAARIDKHYNALRSLSVHFTQKYDGMGMHRQESGILLLKKPGKMRWTYSQPAGKLFVLDGQNAYFYSPGDTEIPRVPAKKLDDLRSPLRFLLGHTKLEKELANLVLTSGPGNQFMLSGVPKGLEKPVDRIALTVTAEGAITSMEIDEAGGAMTRFTFANEQPDASLSAAEFRFTPPPGVPVVDGLPPV